MEQSPGIMQGSSHDGNLVFIFVILIDICATKDYCIWFAAACRNGWEIKSQVSSVQDQEGILFGVCKILTSISELSDWNYPKMHQNGLIYNIFCKSTPFSGHATIKLLHTCQ